MATSRLTSKGQITIPKEVREKLGISPGEDLLFEERNEVFYIKKSPRKSPFNKWVGYLKDGKTKKSDSVIEELRGK
ncbi:MAG TPA: AbrB/MazE/SpoVT family DNA-binding domain-containing protein [Nitrospirae bacterium]|nr:spoVT / AbrB like domain protein [bacterium BMS3Bbin09]HDN94984.1 AbrB/MazE/SpoVT family DNA-binding domain-containing protein [Nitrospirota bacterium]HDO67155.1 AbrB/MazE/SpoVT family DNA-binding domain-containing protein [Nitrospirota bacterium]HDZ84619.1 AbrB/MazE/SpoVT family DNA-binding domain-containing protein [Nitrospirota bacterium]HEW81329.1 AbrB/MazE/SpoVT family DNA-binding domain-containing protein [Nitrospirota bacterium]